MWQDHTGTEEPPAPDLRETCVTSIEPVRPFALIVQNDGGIELADWTPTTTPAELVQSDSACGWMYPSEIDPTLTAWADADAPWNGVPANHGALRLLRLLNAPSLALMYVNGPVLLTGAVSDSPRRYADGLTQDQALHLIERYLTGKRVLMTSLHIPAQRTR